jgi:DNA invertase Pin-like site-specific DNA recombinase
VALNRAKVMGAKLVVAKLDRLSRDAELTLRVRNSGVDFACADNPDVNRLTIGLLTVINGDERERIAERTKAALAAAKARGVRLGNPQGLPHSAAPERATGRQSKQSGRTLRTARQTTRTSSGTSALPAQRHCLQSLGNSTSAASSPLVAGAGTPRPSATYSSGSTEHRADDDVPSA